MYPPDQREVEDLMVKLIIVLIDQQMSLSERTSTSPRLTQQTSVLAKLRRPSTSFLAASSLAFIKVERF